jgi:hypothetical protein
VDTVTKLVSDYISQPDCLILVAISMSGIYIFVHQLSKDDIENQGAASLARQFDQLGKRTIGTHHFHNALTLGVLTKADMVRQLDAFQRWKTIITGEDSDHRLVHGYYLTMQERPEPTSTWVENLQNEMNFFQHSSIWSKLGEPSEKCIGTFELRKKLSLELSRLIKKRYHIHHSS